MWGDKRSVITKKTISSCYMRHNITEVILVRVLLLIAAENLTQEDHCPDNGREQHDQSQSIHNPRVDGCNENTQKVVI